jgi:hypothetical protein
MHTRVAKWEYRQRFQGLNEGTQSGNVSIRVSHDYLHSLSTVWNCESTISSTFRSKICGIPFAETNVTLSLCIRHQCGIRHPSHLFIFLTPVFCSSLFSMPKTASKKAAKRSAAPHKPPMPTQHDEKEQVREDRNARYVYLFDVYT